MASNSHSLTEGNGNNGNPRADTWFPQDQCLGGWTGLMRNDDGDCEVSDGCDGGPCTLLMVGKGGKAVSKATESHRFLKVMQITGK